VVAPLDRLSSEAMHSVLTDPKNALIKQYAKLFEMEGVKLTFHPNALEAVVELAMKRDTGARALRSVTESVMNDLMFDLPDLEGVEEVVITKEVVLKTGRPAMIESKAKRKSA